MVAVHYGRDHQAAQETVGLIEKDGGRAFAAGAEPGTPGAVEQLFDQLKAGLREHTGETSTPPFSWDAADAGLAVQGVDAVMGAEGAACAQFVVGHRGVSPTGGSGRRSQFSGLFRTALRWLNVSMEYLPW